MKLQLNVITENNIDPDSNFEIHPDILEYLTVIANRTITAHERDPERFINKDLPEGNVDAINLVICGREYFKTLFPEPKNQDALGIFMTSTPDDDPFDDGTVYPNHATVYFVYEESFLKECFDSAIILREFKSDLEAYFATIPHEIHHALLFLENANFHSPQDCQMFGDVYDFITGYGIRPLTIRDQQVWSDTADEAGQDIESYVEEKALNIMQYDDTCYRMVSLIADHLEDQFSASPSVRTPQT